MKGDLAEPFASLTGKASRKSKGYHYEVNGQHYYRERKENYQQNQSPRQKWNSAAFKYAHQQMLTLKSPEGEQQMEQAWKAANKMLAGKPYKFPSKWQFSFFQLQWKTEHPYEQWYLEYVSTVSEQAEKKTASETASQYMIKEQIKALHAQLAELEKRLEK